MADQEKERSDIVIEGATARWEFRKEGLINGTYTGVFRFKCYLNPLEKIASNREYRDLLGPNPTMAPDHEAFLAYALTQLKYRIVSSPPFWDSTNPGGLPGNIPDEEIITEVLDAAIGAEVKFKEQLKTKKKEAIDKANRAIKRTEKKRKEEASIEESDEDGKD